MDHQYLTHFPNRCGEGGGVRGVQELNDIHRSLVCRKGNIM